MVTELRHDDARDTITRCVRFRSTDLNSNVAVTFLTFFIWIHQFFRVFSHVSRLSFPKRNLVTLRTTLRVQIAWSRLYDVCFAFEL